VIQEVDQALQALIERDARDSTDVEVLFDAPNAEWAAKYKNRSAINLYLYDIREDLRRRERGLLNEYGPQDDGERRIVARTLPPRHFKLSYLVTSWSATAKHQHELLSDLLTCFLRYEALPPELLSGALAALRLPVPMTLALPPPEDRSFADVWSALGGELKPSLDIVVSVPVDTGRRYEAGPALEQPPVRLTVGGTQGWPPSEVREQHVPEPPSDRGREAMRRSRR
jgi:hypothetical protein